MKLDFRLRVSTVFLLLVLVAGIALAADTDAYVEVGTVVGARCPIAVETKSTFHIPSSWNVTPQQAVELAAKAGHAKCNDIFEQVLLADAESYYVVKTAFGPMSKSRRAVVINGATGRVSVQNSDGP